jgi:hypothetical protein
LARRDSVTSVHTYRAERRWPVRCEGVVVVSLGVWVVVVEER